MKLNGRRRWLPRGRFARHSRGPLLGGVWLRFRTWRRTTELTQALADGAEPTDSDELSLRAGQLRATRTREGVACSLRTAVLLSELPSAGPPGAPLVRRGPVRRCRRSLLGLADRLTEDGLLDVRGLAKAWLLAREGASALFEPAGTPLPDQIAAALAALEPSSVGQPRRLPRSDI